MLYNVIKSWVTGKITLLNETLSEAEKLAESNLNFDPDMLPLNLKDNSYFIKLREVTFTNNESGEINVKVNICK